MKISLIIPALNSAERLPALLSAVRRQTVRPDQILVVDSSSDDCTAGIARQFDAKVITIRREDFDHGGTRSMAGHIAVGDILVYMTDDAVPANEKAFERLLSVFEDDKIGAAYGHQLPHAGADVFGRILRYFNYPATSYVRSLSDRRKYGIKTPFISNSFAAYSRMALEKNGWFKDGLILAEDTYVGAKILMSGYKLAYVSDAMVEHSHNYTPVQDFKRYFDIGVFHRREHWILETFGKAEGEGLKFVLASLKFLKDNRSIRRVPEFFWRTALKYAGYKLGYYYSALPAGLRKKFSMHSGWWNKNPA